MQHSDQLSLQFSITHYAYNKQATLLCTHYQSETFTFLIFSFWDGFSV